MLETEENMSSRTKSKEISELAKTINELAVLFKDLSVLVVEQGTILDRIDYNIQEASDATEKATVHIEKTLEIEKSSRAKGCIVTLAIIILVLTIILALKWSLWSI